MVRETPCLRMEKKVSSSPWTALVAILSIAVSASCLFRVLVLEKHVYDLEIKCQSSELLIRLLQERLDQVMPAANPYPPTALAPDDPFAQKDHVNQSRFRRDTSGGQCLCPAGPPGEPGKRGKRGKKGDPGPQVRVPLLSLLLPFDAHFPSSYVSLPAPHES